MTPVQSPNRSCRKMRIVGYHGDASAASRQRQHALKRSSIHTGLPSAPATWATAVSALITRSSVSMSAAVSAKSADRGARIDDARRVRAERGGIARGPWLQRHERETP